MEPEPLGDREGFPEEAFSEEDRDTLALLQTREQTARDEWEEKKDLERYAMRLEASNRSLKRIVAWALLTIFAQQVTILVLLLR